MKKVRKVWGICMFSLSLLFSAKNSNSQIISDHFFGANAWMPDTIGSHKYNGKLHKYWGSTKNSGASIIRFGGIGPDENKPTNYQYLKMVDSIRVNGMEPIMQVPFNNYQFTAQEAADIVKYLNITKGRNVKYWIIANEPNLVYSYTTAAQVAAYFKPFASAMKDVDPSILIIGPETAGFHQSILTGLTTPGGASDITGKDAAGRYYVDIISFHTYPLGNGTSTREALLTKLMEPGNLKDDLIFLNSQIAACNTAHNRTGASALKTAITEANVNYLNPSDDNLYNIGSNSFVGGQFYAEIMGIALKYGVDFVNLWSIVEGNSVASNKGYIDPATGNKKPLFHHFRLMADNFKGNNANCTDNQANVKSFGCKDEQQISVLILNEDLTGNYPYTVKLNTSAISGANALKVNVDAGISAEYTGVLPSQSSVLLTFNSAGVITKKCEYSLLNHAVAGLAPTCTEFITSASAYSPADNAINVAGNTNLVITFNQAMQKGIGNIIIREGGVVTQTIPVSGTNVSVSGNNVTIDPPVDLTENAAVSIEMDAGVFKGSSNNDYLGIADATAWSFTVKAAPPADTAPPTVSSFSVADNAENVSIHTNLTLTFNEPIQKGTGNIIIKERGVIRQIIPVSGADVMVSGNSAIIDPADFTDSALVNIEMGAGVFKDTADNSYAGITDAAVWNFMTEKTIIPDVTAPTVSSYSPPDNAVNVIKNSKLILTFNEPVKKGMGNIIIKEGGIIKQTISVSESNVTISENTVTIYHSPFKDGALVNIEIDAGAVRDIANNSYTGITDASTWNFSVEKGSPNLATADMNMPVSASNAITAMDETKDAGATRALNVFPNPSEGKFTVKLNKGAWEDSGFEVELFNLAGQLVYHKNSVFSDGQEQLELNNDIAAGSYVLRVRQNNHSSTQRIILNK